MLTQRMHKTLTQAKCKTELYPNKFFGVFNAFFLRSVFQKRLSRIKCSVLYYYIILYMIYLITALNVQYCTAILLYNTIHKNLITVLDVQYSTAL